MVAVAGVLLFFIILLIGLGLIVSAIIGLVICKNLAKRIDFECTVYGKIPKKYNELDNNYNFCNFYCKHFKVNKESIWYNIIKDKIEETYKL